MKINAQLYDDLSMINQSNEESRLKESTEQIINQIQFYATWLQTKIKEIEYQKMADELADFLKDSNRTDGNQYIIEMKHDAH